MNYENHYKLLMSKGKQRLNLNCYTEKHHIIPKSFGGPDTQENLVHLTAREHFIAHRLLAKIYPDSGMVHAVYKMACTAESKGKDVKITSRVYQSLREAHAKRVGPILSAANREKSQCPHCKKIGGIAIMKRWHFDYCKQKQNHLTRPTWKRMSPTEETLRKKAATFARRKEANIPSPRKGKKMSSAAELKGIEKMRQTRIKNGDFITDEERIIKLKERASQIATTHITCPYCQKRGGKSIMKRWHFDNCKFK